MIQSIVPRGIESIILCEDILSYVSSGNTIGTNRKNIEMLKFTSQQSVDIVFNNLVISVIEYLPRYKTLLI